MLHRPPAREALEAAGSGPATGRAGILVTPLAAWVCFALGLGGLVESAAATVLVSRCDDPDRVQKGGYSLRQAIGHANDGDTVDASALGCSSISLALGEIPVAQNSLIVKGPIDHELVVNAGKLSRVLNHIGTGSIEVDYLTLYNGHIDKDNGGCIRSLGSVVLQHSTVTTCDADYKGGAIYAAVDVTLSHSTVTRGYTTVAYAEGGGIMAKRDISGKYSTITYNKADFSGGGLYAWRDVTLFRSTISHNLSGRICGGLGSIGSLTLTSSSVEYNKVLETGGGLCLYDGYFGKHGSVTVTGSTIAHNASKLSGAGIWFFGGKHLTITNSTISDNISTNGIGGGIFIKSGYDGSVTLDNSTIAFNAAPGGGGITAFRGPYQTNCRLTLAINSSIIADNSGGTFSDLATDNYCTVDPSSAFNLVGQSTYLGPSWIAGDPRLGPLAFNGGPTRTHALLSDSPAINQGGNPANLDTDQRGAGYPRISGPAPDVGAYEFQGPTDRVFANGFE